jgi:CheY-like chemotaxis protein
VAKGNGKEAMMFLFRQKEENYLPSLILLDFNMPVMNGKEVLNILKTDDRFKRIPVIVFTTSSGEREHLICKAYDVEMITKPNRVKEFKKVLKDLLGQCISQH